MSLFRSCTFNIKRTDWASADCLNFWSQACTMNSKLILLMDCTNVPIILINQLIFHSINYRSIIHDFEANLTRQWHFLIKRNEIYTWWKTMNISWALVVFADVSHPVFGALNDNVYKQSLLLVITYGWISQQNASVSTLNNLAALLFILPYFIFSATAGQIADKYERAQLVRAIKILEIVIMLIGMAGFLTGHLYLLMIALFMMGIHSTFWADQIRNITRDFKTQWTHVWKCAVSVGHFNCNFTRYDFGRCRDCVVRWQFTMDQPDGGRHCPDWVHLQSLRT